MPAHRAVEDLDRGLRTYYSNNSTQWLDNYAGWQASNDLFITEAVSPEFGGQPLSEMVNIIFPKIYTPYRSSTSYTPISVSVDVDVVNDRMMLDDVELFEGSACECAQAPAA